MEFFKHTTKIDFMRYRPVAMWFSGLLFIVCLVGLMVKGLNLGLDFKGGAQVELSYAHPVVPGDIRLILEKGDFGDVQVQAYGSTHEVLVKMSPKDLSSHAIAARVKALLPDAKVKQVETIGPQVGKALVNRGVLAILVVLLATMVYIALRFEVRFAASAAIALVHDPILILGLFAWFQIEFNLISLAALLTVLGYSLNDTIVVYDRVRENFRKVRRAGVNEIMNLSINQTLSRTIMTSSLTLVVVLALLIFGGEVLFGFSLALAAGILIGTYSSIFVAGALAVAMGLTRESLLPQKVELLDNLP